MLIGVLALAGGFACWWAVRSGTLTEGETGAGALLKAESSGATVDKADAVRRGTEAAADGKGTVAVPEAQPGTDSPAGVNEALIRQLNTALDEPDVDVRTEQWNALLAGMGPNDAKAVRGIFLQNDERGRWFIPEWVSFWKKYGEVDAAAALDEWQASGTPTDPDSPGRIVAAGIKARGMEEAKKLLARDDVKASPKLMKDLVKAVARQAPEQSTDFMMRSVPEAFRGVAAQAIVEAGIDRGGLEQVSQLMETLKTSGAGEEPLQAASYAIFNAALRGGPASAQSLSGNYYNQNCFSSLKILAESKC